MITNVDQIESYFSNPENIHKLYVYEIVDFNNNIESIVSQNTNNFLKIKQIGIKNGLFESATFSPQLKVLTDTNDVGFKINTDYIFVSNDDFSFLERTSKTYVFTIKEEFSAKNNEVFFLTDGSIKAINELSDEDLDKIRFDNSSNLVDLYAIGLQNIKKLEVGKNSTINFMLVETLPDFSKPENKITKLTYKIPINSLIQTIQIIGNIKNDLYNNGEPITNEQLDVTLDGSVGAIPLYVRYKNLNPKANIEILNFSLSKQLPLNVFQKIIKKDGDPTFDKIFDEFKELDKLPEAVEELITLIKKLILSTWLYLNDFSIFDKKNNDFVNYYNATYAGLNAKEYNSNLINAYEMKHPEMLDTVAYTYFKAICYSLSHIIITPYGFDNENLTNEHKKMLWYYIDVPLTSDMVKNSFNKDGSFKNDDQLQNFLIQINSFFYSINFNEQTNEINITNKSIKFNDVINGNYLSKTTITQLSDEWSLVWLFVPTQQNAFEIINSFYLGEYTLLEKSYSSTRTDRFPTIDELKTLLPPDAKNVEVIYTKEHMVDSNIPKPTACPLEQGGGWKLYPTPQTTLDGNCEYRKYIPTSSYDGYYEYKNIPIKLDYEQLYALTVTFKFESRFNSLGFDQSITSSKLFLYVLEKLQFKNEYVNVSFSLNSDLENTGWFISNIKEDYCFGIFNSPTLMTINYKENEQEKEFVYETSNSFQKIDNCNQLTRNKY